MVIGVGGLGHLAIQILAAATATSIVAVDGREAALELAREAGAEHVLGTGAETMGKIRELVGPAPGGAAVVFDFVGSRATLALGAGVISTGGWMALVGLTQNQTWCSERGRSACGFS